MGPWAGAERSAGSGLRLRGITNTRLAAVWSCIMKLKNKTQEVKTFKLSSSANKALKN